MKGHLQVPVLQGRTLYYEAEKLSLLARALALEFLARDTGQSHHVEPRSQIGGRRLVFVDLRAERIRVVVAGSPARCKQPEPGDNGTTRRALGNMGSGE